MSACCTATANFAFNSTETATRIVGSGGVDAVETVMQKNEHVDRVLASALQVLSNLMYKNDENKRLICKVCGDEIVHMLRMHSDDIKVFQSGLRALGTLVYCEENCPIIIGEGATQAIVDGMKVHWSDASSIQLAINVIENLSAENTPVSEAPNSVGKNHHPARHGEDSLQVMNSEGASHIIIQAIKTFDLNSGLIVSAVDALLNLVDGEKNLKAFVREDGIKVVLDALHSHDWDMELVESILRLLVELATRTPKIAIQIADNDGCELCAAVIENFPESQEIVTNASLLLTAIANADNRLIRSIGGHVSLHCCTYAFTSAGPNFFYRNSQSLSPPVSTFSFPYHPPTKTLCQTSYEQGIVEALIAVLQDKVEDVNFIIEPLHTLCVLTQDEDLALSIASKGMHSICNAAKQHITNPELLSTIHKLIGFVAFQPAALRDIVQHDGPAMIIESICENPESRDMLIQAISTIDVICMSDNEHRDICVNEGAAECVEVVQETYEGDEDVEEACRAAMLSIRVNAKAQRPDVSQMLEKKVSAGRLRAGTVTQQISELKKRVDKIRNRLTTGNVMIKHNKSSNPRKRHIVVSSDLRLISWKEAGSRQFKGNVDFAEVTHIESGANTPALKRTYIFGRNPKPECSFTVYCRTRTLDLEANTPSDQQWWVESLETVLAYRKLGKLR
jgi:hypothetical protein